MNTSIANLQKFIEKIRSLTFFQRLFKWNHFRNSLIDAASSITQLSSEFQNMHASRTELEKQLSEYRKDLSILSDQKIRSEENQKNFNEKINERENKIADLNKHLTTEITNCKNLNMHVQSLSTEIITLKETIKHLQQNLKNATEDCIKLNKDEEARKHYHSNSVTTLTKITDQLQKEREDEKQQKHDLEVEKLKSLKETWINHQLAVKNCIKNICSKHTIQYLDAVPFKGEPDNTISICDEYIVFDAKSPAGEDGSNFFSYLKTQTELAKKYAKQQYVKCDIFFVVPSNTLHLIKQNAFHLGDYNVYIISADSIEPIILSLKKIESYEFAQQLSPEERENICRIMGKFAHLTKRRIQIDSFFAKQFMEIVYKCESTLPDDILQDVAAFERSEKLNPPTERRTKAINSKQLETEITQLENEVISKGISIEDMSEGLNGVRLYRE